MIKTVIHVHSHAPRRAARDSKAVSEMTMKELKSELKLATGARRVELQREFNRRSDEAVGEVERLGFASSGKTRK